MDQAQIDKLRAAGFSDDEIRDYMSNQQEQPAGRQPGQQSELDRRNAGMATGDQEPDLDPNAPSETLARAQAAGVPTGGRESSFISDVATVAPVVLGENAGKLALGAGGLGAAYAANQVRKGMQARAGAAAAQATAQSAQAAAAMEQARAAQMAAQGVQQRFDARAAQQAARAIPSGPQILDAAGRPMQPVAPSGPATSGPVAPQVAQAARPMPTAQPASMLDKTTAMIRQLAANKVLQNVARLGGAGLTAGLTSGNIGQNYMVPEAGRMRGMEINPLTGRPWTKEQLDMYAQNPAAFDAQLGAPQMPR
jgi:DNA-binding transcriptional MerR regulator